MTGKVSAYLVKMVIRAFARGYKDAYVQFDSFGCTNFKGMK